MKLKRLLFTALLCLITLPTQASEALTPEGAGHLKAVFESILRDQTKVTSAQGNVTLEQQIGRAHV